MKTTRTLIGHAAVWLAVLAMIMFAGCSLDQFGKNTGSTVEGKGSLTITVPVVSPQLRLLANSPVSGAKGYMFMSLMEMKIEQSGVEVYSASLGASQTGYTIQTTVSLAAGDGYTISIVGYNGRESAEPVVYGNSEIFSIMEDQTTNVRIGLVPYATSTTTLPLDGIALSGSNKTGVIDNNVWIRHAGEKWFSIVPTMNTVTISAVADASHVYFSLFNNEGRSLSSGLSPGYVGDGTGTYGTSGTLISGVTPGATYYVGLITVLEGMATTPDPDNFTIIGLQGQFSDDAYETFNNFDNDSYDYAVPLGTSPVTGLLAYDQDWYRISINANMDYQVDFAFAAPVSGQLRMYEPSGNEVNALWTPDNNTISSLTLSGTSGTAGIYRICLDVSGRDARSMPVPGVSYSITYSIQVADMFLGAATKIPDLNLRGAIEQAIGKTFDDAVNPILITDMEALASLSYDGSGGAKIGSLTGISYCPNLVKVDFKNNSISDLSPLASLSSLADLQVAANAVTDLSPLAGMGSLRALRFPRNQVSSLASIQPMSWLTAIAAHDNPLPLSELDYLNSANFPDLTFISMDGYDEGAGTSLADASSAWLIALLEGHAGDLTGLKLSRFAELGDLGFADLYDSVLTVNAASYTILYLDGCSLTDASASRLATFTAVQDLMLSGNVFTSSSFMSGMTDLQFFGWTKGAPIDIVGRLATLQGIGAFTDAYARIDITSNKLNMWPASGNFNLVTNNLIANGIDVQYYKGNYVHELFFSTPEAGSTFPNGTSFDVQCTFTDQSPSSVYIVYNLDGAYYDFANFTVADIYAPICPITINTAGSHTIRAQILGDQWGGMSPPVEITVIIGVPTDVVIQ